MINAVLTEVRGRVLLITLNRPAARNAIDTDVAQGLLAAVTQLDGNPALTVGVLAGNGDGFCSGMDLKAFVKSGPPKGLDRFLREGARKPLLCAIEGFALAGGLELALSCDLLVAASNAKIGIPEVGVGLFAAGGALLRLPRRLPYGVAMKLALTGDSIDAESAHRYGLVNLLAGPGQATHVALQFAERIARNAPLGVIASKALIRDMHGRTEDEFWKHQLPFVKQVFISADAMEGPRAFAEKRPPVWTGR
jgi:enoyl-CoA hydratase